MSTDNHVEYIHDYGLDVENREIYLHRHENSKDEDSDVDQFSAVRFIKNIRILNRINHEPITIHMSCGGGHWWEALAIFDAIRTSPSQTTVIVYGAAVSASSIILQAATKRLIVPSASLMVHYGTLTVDDHVKAARSASDYYEKVNTWMIDLLVSRAKDCEHAKVKKLSAIDLAADFRRILDQVYDWYLKADEAKYYGLVDDIAHEVP